MNSIDASPITLRIRMTSFLGTRSRLAGRTPQEMTLRVAFLHAARRDFEDAAVWYEERRSGLSAEFRAEVDAAVALAAEQPLRFPRKHKDIRCLRVRRFPYSVFFLQEESRIARLAA